MFAPRLRFFPPLAALAVFAGAPLAQVRPAPFGSGSSVAATERFVFVVHDGVLFKFDADSLGLMGTVKLVQPEQVAVAESPAKSERRASPEVLEEIGHPISAIECENAIAAALEWLCARQDEDGRWDADHFMKHDGSGEICDGPGSATHDVGVTGLVVLALLADGNTMRSGPRRGAVKAAVKWLREQQQENGLIGTNSSHDFVYDHAIATVALCEAFGLSNYALIKPTAQAAINYLESHRNPYSVWRYQPRDNDNDTCVTTWAAYAYTSATFFGLDVNQQALQFVGTWYDQVSDPTGRHGYTKAGEPSSRKPGDHAAIFPVDKGEAMTAAGLFGRFLLHQDPKTKPIMRAAADRLAAKPPRWAEGSIDPYYWMFGTMAMSRFDDGAWTKWSAYLGEIAEAQRKDGNFAGSWDPVGVWDCDGGRVYATAMNALTLSVMKRRS